MTLAGDGSDPEDEMLVYGWRQISGSQVSLHDAAARSTTFLAPVQLASSETLTFVLVATDTRGLSSPSGTSVERSDNEHGGDHGACGRERRADSGRGRHDQVVSEGEMVTLDGVR